MIGIRLEGGLGNQLFQYAAGRALAIRHQTGLLMDLSALTRNLSRVSVRSFELDRFSHAGQVMEPDAAKWLPWLRRMPALSTWVSPWRIAVERGTAWNSGFDRLPDQTYLAGYWQSYRYGVPINRILAQELEPVQSLSQASQTVADQITACASVAVHVRRGDYVSLASAASFHGALPLSYYQAALQRVCETVPGAQVFVFSDDPQWCRENLAWRGAVNYVCHNTGADAWQDLVLMGRCRHHVIANSSFSWWGAWLADQRWGVDGRLVIAPKRWFAGVEQQNLQDRYPAHWEPLW